MIRKRLIGLSKRDLAEHDEGKRYLFHHHIAGACIDVANRSSSEAMKKPNMCEIHQPRLNK